MYTEDDLGNLIDANGNIIFKKGEFISSDEGYYMDEKGNRISRIFKGIGKAIGGAAEATGDFFKNSFNKMFKKEEGVETVYDLSEITWNPETNRIDHFSKNEVEGLANVLKDNPNTKIVVHSFTSDGDNGAENKVLSKTRATVVYDMLVAFGVDDDQISTNGMGSRDDFGNKIQVVVE